MQIKDYRNKLERLKGQKMQLENQIEKNQTELKEYKRSLVKHEQAKEIIREVGLKTQQQLQFHISDITSLALEAVFDNPYKLEVEFVQRRNKTECDIYFSRNGSRINPLDASGGGAVDIASFALRIASWSLQNPHLRNTIILDEPMKNISEKYKERASKMIKEISKKLGIQFIIVTHEPVLTSHADKVFEIGIKKGVSFIKEEYLNDNLY